MTGAGAKLDAENVRVIPKAETISIEVPDSDAEAVASYQRDAHLEGMAESLGLILQGRVNEAYRALVETTEREFKIAGFGRVTIPAGDGMRRLADERRWTA